MYYKSIYLKLGMSSEEFNRKLEQGKKLVMSIKKDLKFRDDQSKRGETTYSVDAEIRGSLSEIEQLVGKLEQIYSNFRANPKDFGLTNKQLQKRNQQYMTVSNQAASLKRQYDACFVKKTRDDIIGSPKDKPDYQQMSTKQLYDYKKKQQTDQEEAIDQLIGVVKNIKQGGKAINTELEDQDKLLNKLDEGMDQNTRNMGRVRRNLTKFLDQSSNCCLITVIVIEIVAIFLILFLW